MFSMCAVCTWTIKSQALLKGDLQLTQCNHFGRAGFPEDVDEDEVIVVEAAVTKEPEVEPAKKSTEYALHKFLEILNFSDQFKIYMQYGLIGNSEEFWVLYVP